ncbi:MAG: metal-dependent hydrolase [Actinomycetota bacterium]|nr:metal-dependent hydrolase [Actinomycetota bacterium]
MLPSGHIAAGVLVGALRGRRSERRLGVVMTGAVVSTCLPDVDVMVPGLLHHLGVSHCLRSGEHHSWISHTPLFWGLLVTGARRLALRSTSPPWAPEAASLLAIGAGVHLAQDTVANTVALLWPLRRREYGLGLDHLGGVTDHLEYMRRYPSSPAGKLEGALILAAAFISWRHLDHARRGRRLGGAAQVETWTKRCGVGGDQLIG